MTPDPMAATRTRLLMFAAFRADGMDVEDAAWLADLLAAADVPEQRQAGE